ncbi:carbohydrate ABC transporter permease [Paenibacillus sp. J5C_2022]|uniref:Carbohydrate ABC transporter permease n=1 Tax=Paenibacillus chungangensis TaxID=696535 RepID=A0ABW3HKY5_9BACL|nr:carbohydrate ABC transporter permease [Paenibacillus sp. J5C2022]MCU6711332.1 carbohydrate ABC transporter permease [Paenibacillus sp. J5C2022]
MINSKRLQMTVTHAFLIVVSISCLYPFFWIIANTFKPNAEILKNENLLATLIPNEPSLANYADVLFKYDFHIYVTNSFIYTVTSVTIGIALGVLISYVVSFYRFPFKNVIYIAIIITMMVPMPGIFIPKYIVISELGLLNSRLGLILPFATTLIPLTMFIVKNFMDSIPKEMMEAATIDGCNKWSKLWLIVVPLTRPAIATVAIFHVRAIWNEWLLPSLTITDKELHPIQSGLMKFQGEHFIDYSLTMTGLVVSMLPLLIMFFLLQKHIINGISSGALKG